MIPAGTTGKHMMKRYFLALVCAFSVLLPVSAQSDNCLSKAHESYMTCTQTCDGMEGDSRLTCGQVCEQRIKRAEDACARQSADISKPSVNAQREGNGCYLGECPDDFEPKTAPSSGNQTASTDVSKIPTSPTAMPSADSSQVQYSWMCQTPQHWCVMNASPQPLPVGSPCFCVNPIMGYANGVVIPQQ